MGCNHGKSIKYGYTLIAIGTTTAFLYSAVVAILPSLFAFEAVYFETGAIIITLILTG